MKRTIKLLEKQKVLNEKLIDSLGEVSIFDLVEMDFVMLGKKHNSKSAILEGDKHDIIVSLEEYGGDVTDLGNGTYHIKNDDVDMTLRPNNKNTDETVDSFILSINNAKFIYGGTNEISRYEIKAIFEGGVADKAYFEEEVYDYLSRLDGEILNLEVNKIED